MAVRNVCDNDDFFAARSLAVRVLTDSGNSESEKLCCLRDFILLWVKKFCPELYVSTLDPADDPDPRVWETYCKRPPDKSLGFMEFNQAPDAGLQGKTIIFLRGVIQGIVNRADEEGMFSGFVLRSLSLCVTEGPSTTFYLNGDDAEKIPNKKFEYSVRGYFY